MGERHPLNCDSDLKSSTGGSFLASSLSNEPIKAQCATMTEEDTALQNVIRHKSEIYALLEVFFTLSSLKRSIWGCLTCCTVEQTIRRKVRHSLSALMSCNCTVPATRSVYGLAAVEAPFFKVRGCLSRAVCSVLFGVRYRNSTALLPDIQNRKLARNSPTSVTVCPIR